MRNSYEATCQFADGPEAAKQTPGLYKVGQTCRKRVLSYGLQGATVNTDGGEQVKG
jgi:hypothetical protein